MRKIQDLRPADHKKCSVQYLGRDFSLGIARKAYYCVNHQVAFHVTLPVNKPKASAGIGGDKNG